MLTLSSPSQPFYNTHPKVNKLIYFIGIGVEKYLIFFEVRGI